MTNEHEDSELRPLLGGLKMDAANYFKKAENALEGVRLIETQDGWMTQREDGIKRDQYWAQLPEEGHSEANRLDTRLVSLMGQVTRAARNAPLSSEADQRDVMTGTKAMRAALLLRRFCSWNTEVLSDEDIVLGTTPPGQSDDEPFTPTEAAKTFAEWADKISAIIDLVTASHDLGPAAGRQLTEATRYRPGTAFIMMWMDTSNPGLADICDAVKEVFAKFSVNALRADDIEHEELITLRVLHEIETSEFCFADLSGNRPNVY